MLIAHFQQIAARQLLALQPIDKFDLVIDPNAILGHVRQPRRAGVFALGKRLPRDRPPAFQCGSPQPLPIAQSTP